jgi:hypothetical protein
MAQSGNGLSHLGSKRFVRRDTVEFFPFQRALKNLMTSLALFVKYRLFSFDYKQPVLEFEIRILGPW